MSYNQQNPLIDALFNSIPPLTIIKALQGGFNQPQDLGKIDVVKPQPQASPMALAAPPQPVSQQAAPQPIQNQKGPSLDANGQTAIGRFLSQMGIPLATTAAGLAFPGALPAASGFQEGFVGEKKRQKVLKDETAAKKELQGDGVHTYTFNPDTGQYEPTGIVIPKGSMTRNLTSKQQSDLSSQIAELLTNNQQGSQKTIGLTNPNQEKILDKDIATQLLNQAGGDKEKARQLAIQQGYKL